MTNALLLEPWPMVAVTASSTASGYSADNVAIGDKADMIGLVWRSAAGASSRSLVIDLGENRAVDSLVLLGLLGAQASWDWSIDLATQAQGAFTGAFWAGSSEDLLAGSEMPVNGLGRALWQAPAGAPAVARYVRINFTGLASAAVEVARVIVAAKIQLDRNFQFGAAFGVRPLGSAEFSIRGVLLRRRGKKLRGVGISFGAVHRDEVEAKVQPLLERVGNDSLVAIVTDPSPDAQRQNRIYAGFLTGDLGTIWARPGGFQANFNLVAID